MNTRQTQIKIYFSLFLACSFLSFVFFLGRKLSCPSSVSLPSVTVHWQVSAQSCKYFLPCGTLFQKVFEFSLPLHGYLTGCLMNTGAAVLLCLSGTDDQYWQVVVNSLFSTLNIPYPLNLPKLENLLHSDPSSGPLCDKYLKSKFSVRKAMFKNLKWFYV